MKYGDKLLAQTVICLCMMTLFKGAAAVEIDRVTDIKNIIDEHAQKNYSISEIKKFGSNVVNSLSNAPKAVVEIINYAGEIGSFSSPIDEDSDEQITTVYATSGGEVIYAGIDDELGMCIKILHNGQTSVYGNLDSLSVITGERVKKGDIIGTYDRDSDQEFYYQLNDSMV